MNSKTEKITPSAEECKNRAAGGGIRRMVYKNAGGDASVIVCSVFNGVALVYSDVHTDMLDLITKGSGVRIEIHYCAEGRLERSEREERFFLSPNDLSVSIKSHPDSEYSFPLRRYRGISVLIDVQTAPRCFSCFLKDADLTPISQMI